MTNKLHTYRLNDEKKKNWTTDYRTDNN
jgi:hypothetical protein